MNFKGLAVESEIVALLSDLVAIESVNPAYIGGGRGEVGVAEYVAQYLRALEIEPTFQAALPGRSNVLGELRRSRDATLIFEAHMDTVTLDLMPDALKPRVRDGRLYGRGACDDKASLAAMLYAMNLLQAHAGGDHASFLLAATVDEELAYSGVLALVESKPRANAAVVGEPTSLVPVIAHKGVERFKIRTLGRAAHTARLEQGNNAIYQMVEVVRTLREKIEPRLPARAVPRVGAPTICVSTIHGGLQVNIVPDECVIEIDRRTVPGESPAAVLAEIDAALDQVRFREPTFQIVREPCTVSDFALDTPPGSAIAQAALTACRALGINTSFGGVSYGSDASKLSELGHIPSIVLGPGDILQAHTSDEWVEISQVVRAAELYAQIAVEFGSKS